MVTQTKVAICVPSGDDVKTDFLISLWNLQRYMLEHRPDVDCRLLNVRSSILVRSRQDLVELALSQGAHYVFFLDSDMTFPPGVLDRLLAHNLDIVGVNAPQRRSLQPCGSAWHADDKPVQLMTNSIVVEQVEYVGSSVLLLRSRVFARLQKPWFDFVYLPERDYWWSEDYFFCDQAKKARHAIFVDHYFDYQIGHAGMHVYNHNGPINSDDFMTNVTAPQSVPRRNGEAG